MEFNEKLQELRKARSLTQEELAEALFVSRTAISKWESGRGYPSLDSLKEISRYFSVSIDDLISSEEIIFAAEDEKKKCIKSYVSLICSIFDIFLALLLFIPVFGNGTDSPASVSLYAISGLSPWIKTVYVVLIGLSVLNGICGVIISHLDKPVWNRHRLVTGMVLSIACAAVFILTRQPYAGIVCLAIMVVKGLLIGKGKIGQMILLCCCFLTVGCAANNEESDAALVMGEEAMNIYDIAQEVFNSEVYPGDPAPEKTILSSIADGDSYNLSAFSMCAHNGTHIDAPFHFLEDGKTVDEVSLEAFVGMAYVAEHQGIVTGEDAAEILRKANEQNPEAAKRILMKGDIEVSVEAANVFAASEILLLGSESQTFGSEDTETEVHLILLGADAVLLEGARLADVPEGVYLLNAAPLNLGGADGAPCRAVLIDTER